jgi:hypothetical protein
MYALANILNCTPPLASGGGGLFEQLGIFPNLVVANAIIFLFVFLVLKVILFDRVRAHMAARDEELSGLHKTVQAHVDERKESEGALAAVKAKLDAACYEETQKQVREGVLRKASAIQAAQKSSLAKISDARDVCARRKTAAVTEGHEMVVEVALEILAAATAGVLDSGDARANLQGLVAAGISRRAGS